MAEKAGPVRAPRGAPEARAAAEVSGHRGSSVRTCTDRTSLHLRRLLGALEPRAKWADAIQLWFLVSTLCNSAYMGRGVNPQEFW